MKGLSKSFRSLTGQSWLRGKVVLCLAAMVAGLQAQTVYTATVSTANQQIVKGLGCFPGDNNSHSGRYFATAPLAVQATLTDLGITMGRINVSYYDGNTDGSLTSYFNDTLAEIQLLKNNNIPYVMTLWCPPLGMKIDGTTPDPTPDSIDASGNHITLNPAMYSNYCAFVVNMMHAIQGQNLPLPVGYSLQNEPLSDKGGCYYVPAEYQTVIKQLRAALDAAGYAAVTLLGPEDGSYAGVWNNSASYFGGSGFPVLAADPALSSAVGAFASHSYFSVSAGDDNVWVSGCNAFPRDRWSTEYCYIDGPSGEDLTDYMNTALGGIRRFMADMIYIKSNYWLWWYGWQNNFPLSSGENLTAGDGQTTLTKAPLFYILRKIYRNVPSGSYVRSVSSTDPFMVTAPSNNVARMDMAAFVHGPQMVVVMANVDTADHCTDLKGLIGATASVFQATDDDSDVDQDMALVEVSPIASGTISSIILPARSVTVVVTSGNNIVPNASFEAGMTGWTNAYGTTYALVTNSTKPVGPSNPTDLVYSGLQAIGIWGNADVRQTLTQGFSPGQTLNFSAWGRLSAGNAVKPGVVGVYCYDSFGTQLLGVGLRYYTTSYVKQNQTFTVPAGTASILVQADDSGAETLYADDIFLVPTNLVANPGFENGMTSWTVAYGTTVAHVNTPVHSGTSAISAWESADVRQTITQGFFPGESLTLSAWGRLSANNATKPGVVGVYCYDGSGAPLLGLGLHYYTTTYVQQSQTFTVPAGTSSILVQADDDGAETLYADDIVLQ